MISLLKQVCLTGPFTVLEPQDKEIGENYAVQERWSTDSKVLELWKGRSGACLSDSPSIWSPKHLVLRLCLPVSPSSFPLALDFLQLGLQQPVAHHSAAVMMLEQYSRSFFSVLSLFLLLLQLDTAQRRIILFSLPFFFSTLCVYGTMNCVVLMSDWN